MWTEEQFKVTFLRIHLSKYDIKHKPQSIYFHSLNASLIVVLEEAIRKWGRAEDIPYDHLFEEYSRIYIFSSPIGQCQQTLVWELDSYNDDFVYTENCKYVTVLYYKLTLSGITFLSLVSYLLIATWKGSGVLALKLYSVYQE